MSLNPWLYVYGNPVRFTDPSGLITEAEAPRAQYIVLDLINVYNVKIKKDWGWRYIVPVFPDIYFLNPCMSYWEDGHWNSIHELELVETAVIITAVRMGGPEKFKSVFGNQVITITRVPINIIFSGMAPPYITPLTGDIIISDLAFTSDIFAKYTVVHELAHVWDWRTGMRLSREMSILLQTFTCYSSYGGGACVFDTSRGLEPPPGDPENPYAGTSPWEDWAESFATFIYPQYHGAYDYNEPLWPLRRQYIMQKINEIP